MVNSCLIGTFILTPSTVWGKLRQFVPKYVDFTSFIELDSLYEKDRNESVSTVSRSDLTVVETFNIKGIGYIYSPLLAPVQ